MEKTKLDELIFHVISQESSPALQMLKCNKIYCPKESHTVTIDSNGVSDIDNLKSNQEEANISHTSLFGCIKRARDNRSSSFTLR